MAKRTSRELRIRRHRRLRKRVLGSTERPRLCVFRSNTHIYVQVIDDTKGYTLVAASTTERTIREHLREQTGEPGRAGRKIIQAKMIGTLIAERALGVGLKKVVFDRGGFTYHGRVQALADAAREAGLEF